ncbi:hypothetical protein C2G38_2163535 [Gigaspora rosea]|uniref:Uncharacterized protein n=1 Tax=Gigaspora rosea TaxID=44941 RepID=A0A397W4M9_9GLOM|nr:hypothetical protein C2G38_2163535 [Gigaspora rosea]
MVGEIRYSSFHLVYGRDALTRVELTIDIYEMFVMKKSWTTEELLVYRALQIKNVSYELENVQVNWDEIREHWKLLHNQHCPDYKEKIDVNDLVLNITLDLNFRHWLYMVRKIGEHGQFYLAKLDGTELRDPFMRNRVKRLKSAYEITKKTEKTGRDLRDEGHGKSSLCHSKNKYMVYLVKKIDLDF